MSGRGGSNTPRCSSPLDGDMSADDIDDPTPEVCLESQVVVSGVVGKPSSSSISQYVLDSG